MLSWFKKRVQEGVCEVPPTMEVTQSSASLEDPRQSPLEVPDQSIHGEQPLGNPRTNIEMILLRLEAGQESLLSEVAQLRTSINQTNEQLKVVESRFSSLEHRICASQQTNSVVLVSASDPRAVPASSSSSFSSQQMILDAAQTAPSPTSPSLYSGDTSSGPPPSSSEQFRNTSSTLRYSEIVEKAHQMRTDAWSQEMNFASETAHLEAEESDNQEDTSSRTSPLITPECETEPQTLISTEETALPAITAVQSLERISESETALARAEESDQQEDTSSRALPSIAPEYKANPQPLTRTEEAAPPVIAAIGSQEMIPESEAAPTEPEESDQQANNFSGGSAQPYTPEPRPLTSSLPETPQAPVLAAMQKKAQGRGALLSRRRSTNKRSSSTALTSTATSAGTRSCLPLLAPADGGPPTKRRRQTSIAWQYFTKQSKYIATCNICGTDVKTGRIGGCGVVGTAALLSHIKRKHGITREKVAPAAVPEAGSNIQDVERPSTTESPSRTASTASTSTTPSPGTLSCLPSSSPTEVRPPTKCQRTSIAWQYFTKQSKYIATCNICGTDVKTGRIGGCGVVGTAALLSHLKRKHGITRKKVAPAAVPEAGSNIQDVERPTTTESPSRTASTASTSTTPSPGALNCLPSSSPTEVRPPTKCQRTSIAWQYFTKQSKYIATCNICGTDVKTGRIGGCGVVGTAALLSHLKRKHGITRKKVAPAAVPEAGSNIQDVERPTTTESPSRTASTASTSTTPSPGTLNCLPSSSPQKGGKSNLQVNRGTGGTSLALSNGA
ncbi:PREDICTED: flocculation protein FLO11-like [Gekko japonicus]|uniref:Flocculation protein FLO11-like n=1 Tax=Gekko japonicus TaxID=146911 RepID=A0ABM1KIM5_GEKJA|nr:PREDICTED: flocculation protein FLO11-like [Gekko japonicus]